MFGPFPASDKIKISFTPIELKKQPTDIEMSATFNTDCFDESTFIFFSMTI